MERSKEPTIAICDAGPLIHLDELNSLDLLADFDLRVPSAAWQEVERHRPNALQRSTIPWKRQTVSGSISAELLTLARALSLDAGELAGLALLAHVPNGLFLTDDAAARLAAQELGYRVHGSIGILLRAIRRHQLTAAQVLNRLRAIPEHSSLHIRPALLEEIIVRLQKEYGLDLPAQT